jgi:hypothetical protein
VIFCGPDSTALNRVVCSFDEGRRRWNSVQNISWGPRENQVELLRLQPTSGH